MNNKEIRNLVKEMISVEYCDEALVKAGETYLTSTGGPEVVNAVATALVEEIKECIVPIDEAIALARSHPDSNFWKGVLEAELKAKEEGMTICGCVACVNGQKILNNQEFLFICSE